MFVHLPCVAAQDVHVPVQALSQQNPSTQGNPPAQSELVVQACPCLALHAPVESHVPGHPLGSSWFLTAVQTLVALHVRQAPAQSLRFTHPTHWLVVMSQVAAEPVQYESRCPDAQATAGTGRSRPTYAVCIRGTFCAAIAQTEGGLRWTFLVRAAGARSVDGPHIGGGIGSAAAATSGAASGASADSTHATAASGACVAPNHATAASGACDPSTTGDREVGHHGHVRRNPAVAGRACHVSAGPSSTAITTHRTASGGTIEKTRFRWRDAGTSESAEDEDSDDQTDSSEVRRKSRSRCQAHEARRDSISGRGRTPPDTCCLGERTLPVASQSA